MPSKARICAHEVLVRVFEHGAYADHALRACARGLDGRERRQAMRLAYGAVQRRGTLDYLIEKLAGRPTGRLEPQLRASLRLGLYELLYLDGAPDRAVVADAVELSKHPGRKGHALVNAVLRRAGREGAALLADLDDDTPAHAAVLHSHPEWIATSWWEQLGPDAARALMAADNEPGEVALRANTLLTDVDALAAKLPVRSHRDPVLPEALVLDGPFDQHESPEFAAGSFIAQSRAAMLVAHALAPEPGERVLDLCAAPGGKSTHLAALMGGRGEVVAVERNRARAGALLDTARRMRAGIVRVELADAALARTHEAPFDRVLVDPPCTGLGTLQARPDLRWRVTPQRLPSLVKAQAEILNAAAQAVRAGGTLVYSTCTISTTENELQIRSFLDSHDDFVAEDLGTWQAGQQLAAGRPGAQTLLTLPHRDHTAGFFLARLRRRC
jgi:16S rRNA (cytosine967-C5)-methyltransferase